MISEDQENCIIFGAFPFRGSIMSCRLICEFVGLQYKDRFFNPIDWEEFKKKQTQNWTIKQLPFLKDGQFVLTNVFAIAGYLAEKSNRKDLLGTHYKNLGNNFEQELAVNTYFGSQNLIQQTIALQCQMKKQKLTECQKKQRRKKYWNQKFQPYFRRCENSANQNWYLGHITIVDFFISQYHNLFSKIFPQQMQKFKKIENIAKNVNNLKQIKEYQQSQRAITQICPNRYFQKFRKECQQSYCSSVKNCCKMQSQ